MVRPLVVGVAFVNLACAGSAERAKDVAAGGTLAVGGQSSGGGAGTSAAGLSGAAGRAGGGGAAAGGAAAGGASAGDAGSAFVDAGTIEDSGTASDVVYSVIVTNPINSGEDVMFTRADHATNTCVFFSAFVEVGGGIELVQRATAFPGADNCCPYDQSFGLPCLATGAGCPLSSSISGTLIGSPASGFDIDFVFEFSPPRMWLPSPIEFRTNGLKYTTCN